MLTEQRYEIILKLLNEKKSITVAEVKEALDTSESTVRRDFTALHKAGRLIKVFGGAVAPEQAVMTHEYTVAQKLEVHREEKQLVARYAASLIEPEDFIYLDAGTTTGCMLDHISETRATYVTNAVAHAGRLAAKGFRVLLVGGELKGSTEAVVGNVAAQILRQYHFSKGFFGTNGISRGTGFTTPDPNEAMVKRIAMENCRNSYVLADSSKFSQISSVTFADFERVTVLTERVPEGYQKYKNVIAVSE